MKKLSMTPQQIVIAFLALALTLTGCNRPADGEAGKAHQSQAEDAGHGDEDTHRSEAASEEHGSHDQHREGAVDFPLDAQKQAKLAVAPVESRMVADVFATTGEFEANADRLAHVKPTVAGRVTNVLKTVGDQVRAGDTLAVLQSGELGEAQAAYLEAQSRVTLAQEAVERQRRLFAEDLTARKEVVAAENALRVARIDLEKARHQLRALGMGADRIKALAGNQDIDATLSLRAPISGVITERHLTLGETVEPGNPEPVFIIVDTSELWVSANLYEKDLSRVRVGQVADVTTPAYPGRTFHGKVSLISPALDPETRTAKARIVVANAGGLLKPEMFANASIQAKAVRALAVPANAVMQDKGETYVFVQTGETTFEKRDVVIGPKAGAFVPVRTGLREGERVATEGAFTLKAELLKESFGEHEH